MRAIVTEGEKGPRTAQEPCTEPCAIERGMRILGGKWTASILWHLKHTPVRFNDLSRMIGGASKKMVAERLRHLEAHELIQRRVRSTAPVSVEYSVPMLACGPSMCLTRFGSGPKRMTGLIAPRARAAPDMQVAARSSCQHASFAPPRGRAYPSRHARLTGTGRRETVAPF